MGTLRHAQLTSAATGLIALLLAACGGAGASPAGSSPSLAIESEEPSARASVAVSSGAGASRTPDATATAEDPGPGDIPWYELWYQATGVPTQEGDGESGEIHIGHVFRAGTLEGGPTVRIELGEPHAFADGPRGGLVLVGGDDGAASEVHLVDARTGDPEIVLSSEAIVWGGTLAPDGSAIYYVPVDRDSMTDTGIWRLELAEGSEAERVVERFTETRYDFASFVRFEWSPNGEQLVGQYCNRDDCHAHLIDPATGEARLHEEAGVFELRGVTDDEYIADAFDGGRSGILAIDLETLETRVLADEWGVSEVRSTGDGPLVVYLAPTGEEPWHLVLVGVPLDGGDPMVVYEHQAADGPPPHHPKPEGADYEPPTGWMVLWPGSPGAVADPSTWESSFLAFEILGDRAETFPYEQEPPR